MYSYPAIEAWLECLSSGIHTSLGLFEMGTSITTDIGPPPPESGGGGGGTTGH